MNVWIVNNFDNLPTEGFRPQRYWLMARAFVRAGHRVTLWTGDFSHATKAKRVPVRTLSGDDAKIEVVTLPARPYPRNVCLARVLSHRRLARTFAAAARRRPDAPDLVVASVPPLGLSLAALRVARSRGARFVADVQDAWPETFERILPRFVWSFLGLHRMARRIYHGADAVTAVAARYVELVREYGCAVPAKEFGHCIEIGQSESHPAASPARTLRLVYAGNIGLSYDLETVVRVVADLPDVTLDIAGDGPDRARIETLAQGHTNIRFHGYLDEDALAALLRECDVGPVPMFPASCVGVPGKLADYAAAGLRVIESLGGETAEIVGRYGVGVHYAAGDAASFRAAVGEVKGLRIDSADLSAFAAHFDATRVMDGYVAWCAARKPAEERRRFAHLMAGLEVTSGIANIARRFARAQREGGDEAVLLAPQRKWNPVFFGGGFARAAWRTARASDEVWVHGSWTFPVWYGAFLARRFGKRLVVLPEGSFDPLRLNNHARRKKRLVAPLDRRVLRWADAVRALCAEEAAWIRAFEPTARIECAHVPLFPQERRGKIGDGRCGTAGMPHQPTRILFLGRAEDPLKGVRYLEKAVEELNAGGEAESRRFELRIVRDHVGAALEADWTWCDVLCLPTLSENFGLVVAEALERGKPAIVTDGAPAWAAQPGVLYLRGYRDGTDEMRVRLLRDALASIRLTQTASTPST